MPGPWLQDQSTALLEKPQSKQAKNICMQDLDQMIQIFRISETIELQMQQLMFWIPFAAVKKSQNVAH